MKNIKKGLFLISLIPLLGIIIGFITSIIEYGFLDSGEFVSPISLENWFIIFNLSFLCFGYPIYYLSEKFSIKKNDKLYYIYLFSFLPYLFLIYPSIVGIDFFGSLFHSSTYYGFHAILISLIICSISPIYLPILIFQIIYTIKKYKFFTIIQKQKIKIILISIISLLILSSILSPLLYKNNLNIIYKKDKPVIEKYLKDYFGNEHYMAMKIQILKYYSNNYEITTPLLTSGFVISIDPFRNAIVHNTFSETFIKEKNLKNKLDAYLDNQFELPNNIKINNIINNINIKEYKTNDNIEDLLNTCDYNIDSFYLYYDYFNKDQVITTIKDFYLIYNDNLKQYYINDCLNFSVILNSTNDIIGSIQVLKLSNTLNTLHLIAEGQSIGNFEEYITLNNN